MRKIIFLFVVGYIISVSAFSQNVVYDKINLDGIRTVVCSGVNLGTYKNMNVYVSLVGFQYKSTERYSLAVSIGSAYKIEIPSTSICTINLSNGRSYEFNVLKGGPSILQSIDIDMEDIYQTFKRFAYYNIKKKYLKKFQKSEIINFELDILPFDFSVSFNNNSLGNNLSAAYATLNNLFND